MEEKYIQFTGPPGCGKDGILEMLPALVKEKTDWHPIVEPEAATIVFGGASINFPSLKQANPKKALAMQGEVLDLQIALHERARNWARAMGFKKVVYFANRAWTDSIVYAGGRADAVRLLASRGLTIAKAREQFAGIIALSHAGKYYTRDNNRTRHESAKQAAALDIPTKHAAVGHPHLWIVPSYPEFEDKSHHVLRVVLSILGKYEIERRFRVVKPIDWTLPELRHAQFAHLRQRYLHVKSESRQSRLRKRTIDEDGSIIYSFCQKSSVTAVTRNEDERDIIYDEYDDLKRYQDPDTRVIKKRRAHILYENQHFEIDEYSQKDFPGLIVLEIELLDEGDPVRIPPYLGEVIEITDDPRYRNSAIAKLNWKMPAPA